MSTHSTLPNQTHSLYGATAGTELYPMDQMSLPHTPLHAISEDKVLISNAECWTEGITYYSMDQMRKDIILDNNSNLNTPTHKKLLSPIYTAIFNMMAGCGVVGLPIQYLHADGIIIGCIITVLISIISIYTLNLLVLTGIKLECQDYERLVSKCFGIYGYYLISFSILLFDTGACLCYTIILGNCAQDLMQSNTDKNRHIFVTFVYILVILPLCVGKNFRFIEKIQIIGIMIYMFFVGFVIYKYYNLYQYTIPRDDSWKIFYDSDRQTFKDWMDILSSVGAITFSFIQHDLSFLVYKTVKNQSHTNFGVLCFIGMAIQCILCILLCCFGYMSFGSQIKDDILRNYTMDIDSNSALIMAIRICYIIRMAFIFPTAFYVVRHVLFAIIYRGYDTYEDTTITKKVFFTIIPLTAFLFIGLYIKTLSDVMTLFGLLSAVNIAFVVPCLCHLKAGKTYSIMFWNAPTGKLGPAIKDVIPPIILIILGVFATVFGSLEFIYFQITNKWLL